MQQVVNYLCKPVLLYNVVALNLSKTECNRIDSVWKSDIKYMMFPVIHCLVYCICIY